MAFNRDLSQLANYLEVNADGTFINIIPSSSEANLGIGTNNPTAKLDVLGNARVSGNLSASNLNISGIITATSGFVGPLTGLAGSATQLATGRTVAITGDIAYTSGVFDGTGNVTGVGTLANTEVTPGSYGSSTEVATFTVDSKGRITAAGTASVGTALTVAGDSGSENVDLLTETLTISGGTNLTSSAASNTLTVNLDPNISLTSVVASGVITATSGFSGNVTGNVTGNINSSGVSTVTSLVATNINASGIVTAAQFVTGASGSAIGINTNTISGPATITIDPAAVGDNTGLVVIKGDLQIDGTTTTINSTTITVDDKNIQIADGAANDAAADGAGITITSGDGNKTFQFQDAGDNLGSSENLNVASGKVYKVNNTEVLSSTTLGSGVINSSLTSVGTLTNLSVGNVNSSGIVTATSGFSGNVTGNLTGNINSSGVSTVTSLNATNINASGIVTATSGFVGNLTGLASSATQLQTARDFSISGDATASSVSFNATANVGLALTLANTAVTPGSYGSSTQIPTFTVDSKGRLTAAGTASVGTALTVSGDSGSENIDLLSESLTISGGTNLTSSAASNSVTVNLDDNISLVSVVASGVITATSGFSGNVTGNVTGNLSGNINSSGVSTVTSLIATNINASGIVTATSGFVGNITGTAGTITTFDSTNGTITNLTGTAGTITTFNSTNGTITNLTGTAGTITNLSATNINASGIVTATSGFVGNLTGTAATTTNIPNLTGDITSLNLATTLATVNSNVGSFGSQTLIPVVTVNAKGLVTSVTTAAVGTALTVSGDSGSENIDLLTESLTISGGTNLTSSAASNTVTVNLDNNISLTSVVASGVVTATSGFSGNVTGNLTGNINSSGVSTVTSLNATNINASGIVTATQFVTGASGSAIGISTNTISGPATITIDPAAVGDNTGLVVIKGDLQIDGTTTTINSTTITIDDKNIQIADGAANDAAADGAGFTIVSGDGNKTFQFQDAGDNLGSSENLNVTSGKVYKVNNTEVLSNNTLGSGVVNSSLTSVGTLTNLSVGNVNSSGIVTATTFVGALTGNVTGNINSSGVSTVTSLNATNINASGIVTATSGFVGNLTGLASSATQLATGRTVAITGDIAYTSESFNGTGNVTGTGTLATVNSNVGSFGSQTLIPVVTVNAKGLVTAVTTAAVGTALTVSGDSGSENIDLLTESLTISGGTNLTSSAASNSVTVNLDPNISLTSVVASGVITATSGFSGNVTGNLTGEVNAPSFDTNASGVVVTGIATATTFVGALTGNVTGNLTGDINSSGVSTVTSLNATNINTSGVVTATSGFVGNVTGNVTGNINSSGVSTVTSLVATNINASGIVTATSGFVGNVTGNLTGDINSSGVSTVTSLNATNINTSGIVTATSGFVGNVTGNLTGEVNAAAFDTNASGVVVTGVTTSSSGFVGNLTGLASSATQLATGRTVAITGDLAYTSGSFDGTSNVTGTGTLATVNSNVGSFGSQTLIPVVTVNAKGLVTSVTTAAVGTALTVTGDSGSENIDLLTESLSISGGTNLTSSAASNSVTVNLDPNISLTSVVASGIITATSGFVGNVTGNLSGNINSSGVSTVTSLIATNINASGIVTATQFVTGASGAAIGINTNTISGPATITIDPAGVGDNTGAVRIKGDLFVDGTQFIVNSTTIELADFVVGIASTATTDILADGAGIKIGPDNTLTYDHTNTALKSSENLNVASGKTYKIDGTDVLSSTTLGSGVVNSSLTSVGTLTNLSVGNVNSSGIVTATTFVGALNGNVTGDINSSGVSTVTSLNATNINTSGIVTATSGFVGNVTGNVTGNLTGNVTGNINSSGVSTVTSLNATNINASGIVTATSGFVGNLTGTAATTTNIPNLTGDISSVNTSTTLATVNSNVGSFGSQTLIPVVTVNAKGLVTAVTTAAVGTALTVAGDSGSENIDLLSESLTISGGTNLTSSAASNTVTVNLDPNISLTSVVASGVITATSGFVGNVTGNVTGNLTGNVTGNINSSGVSTVTSLNATNINASGIVTATSGFVGNITGTAGTITTFNSTDGTITNLTGTAGTITTFNSTNGTITNGTITNLTGTAGTITTFNSTTGTITNLSATNINASGIVTATSGFVGNVTGTATSTTNIPNLSGDITSANTVTTLATVNSNVGSFGSQTLIPVVTVNAKGLVTAVTTAAVGTALTVSGDSGSENIDLLTESLTISGGTNLTSSAASNSVTVNLDPNISLTSVVASGVITATSGFVGNVTGNVTGNINSSGVSTVTSLDASNINTSGIVTAAQFVTGASGSAIGINTNTISGPATITIDPAAVGDNTGLVVIKGDLQIDGTTTTINSTTVTVDDKNIVLGSGAINDAAADGSGITIESGNGNKTFQFEDTGDNLGSSENLNVASGKVYKVNNTEVLSNNTLGSGVVNSSLTSVGTLTNLSVGNVNSSGIVTAVTVNSTNGTITNLTGTAGTITTFNSTNGTITNLNATNINASGIVTATSGFSGNVTGNLTGEVNAAAFDTNASGVVVTGVTTSTSGFVGNLTGLASSATQLATGRTVAITGDLAYTSGSFDGTGDVTGTGTLATVNSNVGSFGSQTLIPVVTVNAKGLVTSVTTAAVGTALTVAGDSGSVDIDLLSETLTVAGGTNLTSVGSGNTLTINLDNNISLTSVVASGIITATSGFVGNVTGNLTGNVTGNINSSGVSTVTNLTIGGYVSIGNTIGSANQVIASTGVGVTWKAFNDLLPQTRTTQTFTATASQTLFSFAYNVNFLDVFVNGVKLSSGEFTASNGTTITLSDPSFVNDNVEFVSYATLGAGTGQVSSLNDLTDVTLTGITTGNILAYNGSEFVNTSTLSNITALDATTTATIETAIAAAPNNFTSLNISGVSTVTSLNATNINASGIVTATSGFVGNVTGNLTGNVTGNINSSGVSTVTSLNATNINASGISTFQGGAVVGSATTFTEDLVVQGDARVTGILTVGTASITLNGENTVINVGAATTIHTTGFAIGNSFLHSTGLSLTNLNASGIVTAAQFVGAITGTASTTTNIPNLTGAITSNNTTTSLGSFSSSDLATALTDETGSGSAVFATSPTLVTPVLGAASATSINVSGIVTAAQFVTGASGVAIGINTNTISGPATITIDPAAVGENTGLVVIKGDLQIDGTTTTVNSTTMTVDDINITLASGAANAAAANGAGITIDGASATLLYASTGDKWVFNKDVEAGNFNSTSDINLKENIRQVESASELVSKLEGVHFSWKETGKETIGVIAQQIEEHLPQLVQTGDTHKTVNYNGLIGVLIEAVKEQQKQIEELKDLVNDLTTPQ